MALTEKEFQAGKTLMYIAELPHPSVEKESRLTKKVGFAMVRENTGYPPRLFLLLLGSNIHIVAAFYANFNFNLVVDDYRYSALAHIT